MLPCKAYGETADCIKADDVTVTVVCWARPRKLFRYFSEHKIRLSKRHPGIYHVERDLLFPVQIVVARELDKREHVWLRALSKKMERDDFERLSEAAAKLKETANGEFIDSVLQVSIRANEKKLKEDKDMCCEALRELFEPELKESWKKGQKQGQRQGWRQGQRQSVRAMVNTMTKKGYHSDEIIDIIMQSFQLDRNEAMKYFTKS